jgi:hypothetical protein
MKNNKNREHSSNQKICDENVDESNWGKSMEFSLRKNAVDAC